MQNLVPNGEWLMAAILGMDDSQVEEACRKAKSGFVVPANYNCKGQIAISGEKAGVEEAASIAKEMGARKAMVLKTAGPFHTEKLIDSSNALRKELENISFGSFNTKVVKNIDGEVYSENDDIKDILARHIISPVRFAKSIETMLNEGVDTFIEVGAGKTLAGFVKRTPCDREITIININNAETLENAKQLIKKN